MRRTRYKGYFHYVYVTMNTINGKMYVGDHTTKNLNDHYRGSGRLLYLAFKRYGKGNFLRRRLQFFPTRQEAHIAETYYIIQYDTLSPTGYNICPTGGLGNGGGIMANETKQKLSILLKAWLKTPEGIAHNKKLHRLLNTPEFISKRSISFKIWYKTPEGIKVRKNASKRMSGENSPINTSEAIAKRKDFYQTSEGITMIKKRAILQSIAQKAFLKTSKGTAKKERVSKSFKAFYKTSAGIAKRERLSKRMSGENHPLHNPKAVAKSKATRARNRAKKQALQRRSDSRARLLAERQGRTA